MTGLGMFQQFESLLCVFNFPRADWFVGFDSLQMVQILCRSCECKGLSGLMGKRASQKRGMYFKAAEPDRAWSLLPMFLQAHHEFGAHESRILNPWGCSSMPWYTEHCLLNRLGNVRLVRLHVRRGTTILSTSSAAMTASSV